MGDFLIVMGLALLPAIGNFSGGLIAEFRQTSKRNLNRALHAAAGIVLAIVAVELMPRALNSASGWVLGVAFGLGGLAYVCIEKVVKHLQRPRGGGEDRTSMWMTIAERENVSPHLVRRYLDLALLPTSTVEAIVAGQQPIELTSETFKQAYPLPIAWSEQKQVLRLS